MHPGYEPAAHGPPAQALREYYRSADVRARLAEYCGALSDPAEPSAWGIAGYGGRARLTEREGAPVAQESTGLAPLLEDGADVCRSLADRGGTLLQLDVDYNHPEAPAEAYRQPAVCFRRLEPVYEAVLDAFRRYGIRPLVVMTARGYHFTVRAPADGPLHASLVGLGALGESLERRYQVMAEAVPGALGMGRAHHGAGKLLEHLCHVVMRETARRAPTPVAIADVPPPGLRPFVCLDISAYGDPLFARYARCAFSSNQKAWMRAFAPQHPWVIALPREALTVESLLRAREDPRQAARLAATACARIPDAPGATGWLEEYERSDLRHFHRAFEAGPHAAPSTWAYTYDALDLDRLPLCVRVPLRWPNPHLLTPVHLRTVVRVLRDLGWHPRSIAELARSRYERGESWGGRWRRYDAQSRALFDTRVLLGCLADGLDAEAFDCETQARRGACVRAGCGFDLARLRPPHRPFS
jgi:hypothetical protein